jgi:hypothetical protein
MAIPGEGFNAKLNPHDVWADPVQADRQVTILARMEQDNPRFLQFVEAGADLLLDGEMPPYDQAPQEVYAGHDVRVPSLSTYEDPFPDRHGFLELSPDDLRKLKPYPNPTVHLALDAAVKKRDPDAFVAVAVPGVFDGYDDNNNPEHPVEYYVLGRSDDTEDPVVVAERALAFYSDTPRASLAPRYSARGAETRAVAKADIARGYAEYAQRRENADALGGAALRLMTANGINELVRQLGEQYGLASTDKPSGLAREALQSIWINFGGRNTTASTLQELVDNAGTAQFGDVAKAFARLYPDDTPEQLAARLS